MTEPMTDEPKPWPRAQRIPFVVTGERAQPHHFQAIAEYDEARGETAARHGGLGVYTAAQVNQAIEWWNKRAVLEAAAEIPKRLPEERLAKIREEIEADSYGHSYDGGRAARELLAEVDRFRALEHPVRLMEVSAGNVTPEQIAEWQAAWDKLCAGQIVGYDLRPAPWPPGPRLSDRLPRSHDYPAGG